MKITKETTREINSRDSRIANQKQRFYQHVHCLTFEFHRKQFWKLTVFKEVQWSQQFCTLNMGFVCIQGGPVLIDTSKYFLFIYIDVNGRRDQGRPKKTRHDQEYQILELVHLEEYF